MADKWKIKRFSDGGIAMYAVVDADTEALYTTSDGLPLATPSPSLTRAWFLAFDPGGEKAKSEVREVAE